MTKPIDDLFREPLNVGARQNATKGDNRSARTDTRNRQLFKFAATSPAFSSERGSATIRYIDRANMNETFADSITGLIFDGQMLRIELGVTRFDEMKPDAPISGRRYPACRLVLPPAAAVDLINRMQQIAAALTRGETGAAPSRRSAA